MPRLRFPGFENAGNWKISVLAEIGDIITGNTPKTSELENYGGSRLFVSPADIDNSRYIVSTKTKLSDIGFSKTRQIQADSVLFVCIGSNWKSCTKQKRMCY